MKSLIILFYFFVFCSFGQRNIFIHLQPKQYSADLNMADNYTAWDNSLFHLDHFKYYVSDFIITHDGGQLSAFPNQVYLIDPSNYTLYLGYLPIQQIEKIEFTVGVPNDLNTQDGALSQDISIYPESHPLSFQSPSMYWGWQFGYMHMIIGGWNDMNNNNTLEPNEGYFEIHTLGDHIQQNVSLPQIIQTNTSSDQTDVYINCHLDRWIQNIPLGASGISHESTGVNEIIMNNVITQNVFELSQLAEIQSSELQQFNISVSKGELLIEWHASLNPNEIIIYTSDGKIIYQQNLIDFCENLHLTSIVSGIYFINCTGKNGIIKKTVFVP